ncbi:MAG: NYN domain-containing protein [Rhizobiales bacterium]|nr:NYN domain-containing protein [Hyphomicrobiales bacterium]
MNLPKKRAALYVDGFNLYHSINDLDKEYLKWCNLWRLGENIIPKVTEELKIVTYCSAYHTKGDFGKLVRHQRYVKALETVGVNCVLGHFVKEDMDCRHCDGQWEKPTEKETDINVALSLYDDALHDRFDHAYLLTADSDQAATARMYRAKFQGAKKLTTVSPPGRNFSKDILRYADGKIALDENHIDLAAFSHLVSAAGKPSVLRPEEYIPPAGWVHPDQRP